jgi:predicted amidohydrolase
MNTWRSIFLNIFLLIWALNNSQAQGTNLVPNPNFTEGPRGGLPAKWTTDAHRPSLLPSFRKSEWKGQAVLEISGTGRPDVNGHIKTELTVEGGKTYLYKVRFRISDDVNPQRNLLFQCYGPDNRDGIFEFVKKDEGWIEGSAPIYFPGSGPQKALIRIIYRHNPKGRVFVQEVSLTETSPVPERWVRVGVSAGIPVLDSLPAMFEKLAHEKLDLFLLPEYMNEGRIIAETIDGPSCRLLSEMARKYRMYVAGGIVRKSDSSDQLFNSTMLYDRNGKLVGFYDKIHLYSPEVNDEGITPGNRIVVLKTDFGKLGFMTCYDSWFTDVAEMNALKGAELILFPNAGYYRSLLPARAADNRVRIMASSLYNKAGIWDTGGRDVQHPDMDPSANIQQGMAFNDTRCFKAGNMEVVITSLNLNFAASPHYNGGTMHASPGGSRNRADQLYYLDEEIKKEKARWWKED